MTIVTGPAAGYLEMLQRRMKAMGLYQGAVDHDWGSGTQSAFEHVFTLAEAKLGIVPPPPAPAAKWPKLDPDYAWLRSIGELPPTIAIALEDIGTVELAGGANSATIMGWAAETGLKASYTADSVPWCGLFMAHVVKKAGFLPPGNPLWALNWNKFGSQAGQPELGDVMTFTRNGGGHVSLYVGEDSTTYHILGGNQSDQVNITRIEKKRLSQARRPPYPQLPATVRPFVLSPVGRISTNEA